VSGFYTVLIQEMAEYFSSKNHEVHIVTYGGDDAFEVKEKIHLHKIDILAPFRKLPYIYVWGNLWDFWRIIYGIKPDVINAHYIADISGTLSLFVRDYPYILSTWGSDVLKDPSISVSEIENKIAYMAMKKSAYITVESSYMRDEIVKNGIHKSKINLIPFGTDRNVFFPPLNKSKIREKLGLGSEPLIISTRRFESIYNIECLLESMPIILSANPEVKLLLLGSGRLENKLKIMAKKMKISKSIIFTGFLRHEHLSDYLKAADIYVSTSLSDSSSVSLLEAMSCGLAPVVSDAPSNDEWVKDGWNGYIFPRSDSEKLAKGVSTLLSNTLLRKTFGKRCATIIAKDADSNKCFGKFEKLYTDAIESFNNGN